MRYLTLADALVMFLALNGRTLEVPTEDAITTVLGIAAGDLNEEELGAWLRERVATAQEE